MIKLEEKVSEGFNDQGISLARAVIFVDSPEEIPEPGIEVLGMILTQGSVVIVINTSKIYMLNGSGVWKEWGGGN